MCAGLPFWLEGEDDEGEELDQDLAHLHDVFNETIKARGKIGKEWLEASEKDFLFRDFAFMLNNRVHIWATTPFMERWVDERLAFDVGHPGVGMPQKILDQEILEQYGLHAA